MALAIFCLLAPKLVTHSHEHTDAEEHMPASSDEEDCAQCQFYFSSFFLPDNDDLVLYPPKQHTHYTCFDAQLSAISLSFYTGLAPPLKA